MTLASLPRGIPAPARTTLALLRGEPISLDEATLAASMAWAVPHGLGPRVYWEATRQLDPADPVRGRPPLVEAKKRWQISRARASFHLDELERIASALEADGIPSLAYKGPTLGALVYPDPGLREFSDLDVIVPPEALDSAISAVARLGYHSEERLPPVPRAALLRSRHSNELRREDGRVVLDLHWRIVSGRFGVHVPFDALLSRARPSVGGGGRHTRAMGPADMLVSQAVHAGHHLWGRLDWLVDVRELLAQAAGDGDALVEDARAIAHAARAERHLELALELARSLFGVGPGARLDGSLQAVKARALRLLLGGRRVRMSEMHAAQMALASGDLRATTYLLESFAAPSAADWTAYRLPPVAYPLYVPLRAWRLFSSRARRGAGRRG